MILRFEIQTTDRDSETKQCKYNFLLFENFFFHYFSFYSFFLLYFCFVVTLFPFINNFNLYIIVRKMLLFIDYMLYIYKINVPVGQGRYHLCDMRIYRATESIFSSFIQYTFLLFLVFLVFFFFNFFIYSFHFVCIGCSEQAKNNNKWNTMPSATFAQ